MSERRGSPGSRDKWPAVHPPFLGGGSILNPRRRTSRVESPGVRLPSACNVCPPPSSNSSSAPSPCVELRLQQCNGWEEQQQSLGGFFAPGVQRRAGKGGGLPPARRRSVPGILFRQQESPGSVGARAVRRWRQTPGKRAFVPPNSGSEAGRPRPLGRAPPTSPSGSPGRLVAVAGCHGLRNPEVRSDAARLSRSPGETRRCGGLRWWWRCWAGLRRLLRARGRVPEPSRHVPGRRRGRPRAGGCGGGSGPSPTHLTPPGPTSRPQGSQDSPWDAPPQLRGHRCVWWQGVPQADS